MKFRSPWRHPIYRRLVALVRTLLRPFGRLESRFIEQRTLRQNRRVRKHLRRNPPRTVLLIMPRCVKKSGCHADVRSGLQECLACMGCPLGDVALLCHHHGVQPLVAFRSHIAFGMAREKKPDVIIATACHDRLIKALRSVPEYPALLAPLTAMDKPCVNAGVDLVWLEEQLAAVARPQPAPTGRGPAPLAGASEGT